MPAILKGYIDRVFLPGVAFKLPEGGGALIPLLTNINKVGVVTTYGATQPVVIYAGDNSRNLISRGLRPLFNSNCPLLWMGLYNLDSTTLENRVSFLKKVENSFSEF